MRQDPPELIPGLDALENRLLTTRGVRVQPPSTCVKPVAGLDVDDLVVNLAVLGADPAGTRDVILERVVGQPTILHGLGVRIVQPATAVVNDPWTQLRLFLTVDDAAPGDEPLTDTATALSTATLRSSGYQNIGADFSNGLQQLTWLGLAVLPKRRIQLVVERIAPTSGSATDFNISARWKGWTYPSTARTDRGDGFHAF